MKFFKLFENWDGEPLSASLNEASIFDPKYDNTHPFVLSRDKKDSGEDMFKKAFKVVPKGVLHKTQDEPKNKKFIFVNPRARSSVKVNVTDGKNVYSLTDSTSKLQGYFTHGKKDPKNISWKAAQLESAACLGLYISPQSWINDLQSGDIDKAAKTELIAKKEIKKYLSSSNEFLGAHEILSKLDNITVEDLVKTLVLANGGSLFADKYGCKGWNFIQRSIVPYYDAEKANPNVEMPGAKQNTADTIYFNNKSLDKFLDEVEKEPITFDSSTGKCTTESGTEFYQISNKESAKNSQLGRIKEVIDQAYGLPKGRERFELELNEGLIDWVKSAAKYTKDAFTNFLKKIKEKLQKFSSSILNSLDVGTTKTTPPKPLDDFIKGQINEGLITEGMNYNEYAAKTALDYLNNDTTLMTNLYNKVIGEWSILEKTTSKVKGLKVTPNSKGPKLPSPKEIPSKDDARNLVLKYMVDYSAYYDLNAMFNSKGDDIKDASTILDEFVDYEKEMVFGRTELPIYKLYGSNGDNKTPWVYLSSGKEFKEKRKKIIDEFGSSDLPGVVFESSLQDLGHTAVYLYVFHDFNDPEGFIYTEVAFRGGGTTTYAYSISGSGYTTYQKLKKNKNI